MFDLASIWMKEHQELISTFDFFELIPSDCEIENYITASKFFSGVSSFPKDDREFIMSGNFEILMKSSKFPIEFRVGSAKALYFKYKFNEFDSDSNPLDLCTREPIPSDKEYILNECYYNRDNLISWISTFRDKHGPPTDPRTREVIDDLIIQELVPNFRKDSDFGMLLMRGLYYRDPRIFITPIQSIWSTHHPVQQTIARSFRRDVQTSEFEHTQRAIDPSSRFQNHQDVHTTSIHDDDITDQITQWLTRYDSQTTMHPDPQRILNSMEAALTRWGQQSTTRVSRHDHHIMDPNPPEFTIRSGSSNSQVPQIFFDPFTVPQNNRDLQQHEIQVRQVAGRAPRRFIQQVIGRINRSGIQTPEFVHTQGSIDPSSDISHFQEPIQQTVGRMNRHGVAPHPNDIQPNDENNSSQRLSENGEPIRTSRSVSGIYPPNENRSESSTFSSSVSRERGHRMFNSIMVGHPDAEIVETEE